MKKNYIGRGRKMRLDYMIRILTQDVEPDFMRAHVRCGLGFQGRHLCMTEKAAKECAEQLTFEDAERCIEELEDNLVCAPSYFKDIILIIFTST